MKLTEDEQKEKQIENYKMMSAISGRNINDFIGDSHKNNYNEKDCLIKHLFLKNLVDPISSDDLWNVLKAKGYTGKPTTFRGLLNRYQKYEYVRKVNEKKPFLYQITQLGNEHIKNPYLAREEGVRRYKEFQLHKLKEIIENYPELFKSIYESIRGAQNSIFSAGNVVSSGSQYSGANAGRIEEYRNKIEDDGFLQSVNEDKIKELIELGDPALLTDFVINLQDYYQRHKSSMTFKQQEYQSNKPVGERKYYEILIKATNQFITKSTYEAIPFRFIRVGNEYRVKGISESGTYKNNQDGIILSYEDVIEKFGNFIITCERQNNEIIYYYSFINGKCISKEFPITTMSLSNYEKVKNKHHPTLRIKTN